MTTVCGAESLTIWWFGEEEELGWQEGWSDGVVGLIWGCRAHALCSIRSAPKLWATAVPGIRALHAL